MAKDKNNALNRAISLATAGLAVAAVVKELRLPAEQRTWHGTVLGIVPYDLRVPTFARFRERLWEPDNPSLLVPHVFGVGWTLNVGRVVHLIRGVASRAAAR